MAGKVSDETIVEVSGLSTKFGTQVVHRDIDLNLLRGEILALVGGSGSGKSTLLREILLLARPTTGLIKLFGEDARALPDRQLRGLRRRMGVLFQYGALFSSMTVLENIGFPLREHTRLAAPLIDEIAFLKVRLVGLPAEAAHKLPSALSGGMRKRAGLARALALDPELLFLDEPTSGLDPVGASEFDELILRLRSSLGLTVMMVTHDLDSLWRVADRIAMLGEARLLALGSKDEVSRTSHPLVQAFFSGARGRGAKEQPWKQK